ncbi:FtsB family cell division protein [Paenibacillus sp. MMS18-CY102]|uniref:FtsB family cell division protein n=1 Tax=Paenibacillus sp. MMS18-CY102 TaxID=2682849 RepID=UPI001365353E|nr:septum formation initiator family protein [Paenibacillus sp. MMS18-CY102]MWC30180.1 septum formation initiator family protein [Paenibacillus sp. MMS18-CY102]
MANVRQQAASAAPAGTKRRKRLWLAFVIIFACWALYTLINQEHSRGVASQRLSEVKVKKAAAEKQLADLKQEIDRLHDPEYIGQLASQQGMVRDGEKVIQLAE